MRKEMMQELNPQQSEMSRRNFLKSAAAGAAALGIFGASSKAFASNAAHIVIVGGGIGGTAAAKYMRLLNADVKITVIEPNAQYIFCPGSNEVIPGWETLESLTVTHTTLKHRYGVNVVQDHATEINYTKKQVKTAKGEVINYDKLIVSPGPTLDYEAIDGYNKALAESEYPAAWHAGPQTLKLREQILAMKKGGTVIISSPKDPYRCPPAPYERASYITAMLKEHNPTGKLIILDAKDSFIFQNVYPYYWKTHFGYGTDNSLIEWVSKSNGGEVVKLDATNRTVVTADGTVHKGDVINIIPPEKAGQFAIKNGLNEGDWCPVDFRDFTSTKFKDVHVIGDSVDGDPMPKTGYIASNQAKVVVQAINEELHGRKIPYPFITNECVAMAGEDFGMTLAETFRYAGEGKRLEEHYDIPGAERDPARSVILEKVAKNWQRTFRKDIFS